MKSEKSERRKKLRSIIKMVIYPGCLVFMMVVLTSCLSFKEKEKPLKIDYDKCQEVLSAGHILFPVGGGECISGAG